MYAMADKPRRTRRAALEPRAWALIVRPALVGDWHARPSDEVRDRALARRLIRLGIARRI
jgi:hypothetical protein